MAGRRWLCRRKAIPIVAVMRGLVIAPVRVDDLCAHADNPSGNAEFRHGCSVYRACVEAAPADSVKLGVLGLGGNTALLCVCGHCSFPPVLVCGLVAYFVSACVFFSGTITVYANISVLSMVFTPILA